MKLAIASLLLGLHVLTVAQVPGAADEQTTIRALLDQRKYKEALDAATALNKRVPDNVLAYEFLAEAQLALGKVEEAEKSAQWMLDLKLGKITPSGSRIVAKIRKHYKDYDGAAEILVAGYRRLAADETALRVPMLLEIAEMYKLAGKTAAADKVLEEVHKLTPAKPATPAKPESNAAAGALQKLRETSDPAFLARAEKLVTEELAKNPGNHEARISEIEVQLHKHEFRRAIELAQNLVKSNPNDPRIHGMLGDAQIEIGDYNAAADAYEKMLALKPSLASYNRAAHFRYVTGDLDGAIEIMRRAARMGGAFPENTAWCWVETGNLMLKKDAVDEAQTAFQTALLAFPNYHPAVAGLGKVEAARGNHAAAISHIQKAIQSVPLPEYVGMLHGLYLKTGNQAEAAKQWQFLEQIDKLGRATGELTNRKLALIFADNSKQLERALELTTAELKVRQDVFTYDAHAWVLFRNGKVEEAREYMRKALAQGTAEPMFRAHARAILGESTVATN